MKVLITGASGFVGRNLIHTISSDGETEIYALSRSPVLLPDVKFIQGDVLDAEQLNNIFSSTRFDAVIHLAAITSHDEIVNNKAETFNLNLHGTINLLNCFNTYCENGLFLFASTGKVYGKTNEMPVSEKAALNPINLLGKSKKITEEVIDFYAVPKNNYLICRIFNIYGENQKRSFVVPTIIDQLKQPQVILGSLEDQRDYLYIDDLSSALKSCIDNAAKFSHIDSVNIGSGEPTSVADILREIEKILGITIHVKSSKARFRPDETPVEFCTYKKLSSITDWKPVYSLRNGLYKTLKNEGVMI